MRFRAALLSRALELGFPQRQDGKEGPRWETEKITVVGLR